MKKEITKAFLLFVILFAGAMFADSDLHWTNPQTQNGTFVIGSAVITNSTFTNCTATTMTLVNPTVNGTQTNAGTNNFTGVVKMTGTTTITNPTINGSPTLSGTNAMSGILDITGTLKINNTNMTQSASALNSAGAGSVASISPTTITGASLAVNSSTVTHAYTNNFPSTAIIQIHGTNAVSGVYTNTPTSTNVFTFVNGLLQTVTTTP